MGWRFRQSFKIIPGLKLNLSKTGLSASIAGAPFTLNLGKRGLYGTASIPGTGVSFRQKISGGSHSYPQPDNDPPLSPSPSEFSKSQLNPAPPSETSKPPIREVCSANTELLTSESLKGLKQLIQTAYEEHEEISREFSEAQQEDAIATSRFNSWDNGFLLKKLFKKSFEARKVEAELATAKAFELKEQLRLTTISTHVVLENEQADSFFRLRDDFTTLSDCNAIWDVKAERKPDQFHERTNAIRSISRERVRFSLGKCNLLQWEQEVPHLQNINGGDIFLYPGFILYRASNTAFSIIDFHDVKLEANIFKFYESDGVPSDSKVVGQTWTKINKDGSRDKRFADIHQIPIVLYGGLTFRSETGLWEEFQISNPDRLERFIKSWNTFVNSFDHRISLLFDQEVATPPTVEH